MSTCGRSQDGQLRPSGTEHVLVGHHNSIGVSRLSDKIALMCAVMGMTISACVYSWFFALVLTLARYRNVLIRSLIHSLIRSLIDSVAFVLVVLPWVTFDSSNQLYLLRLPTLRLPTLCLSHTEPSLLH